MYTELDLIFYFSTNVIHCWIVHLNQAQYEAAVLAITWLYKEESSEEDDQQSDNQEDETPHEHKFQSVLDMET